MVITALLQVSVLDYFKIFGVKPDFLLILVVLASLSFELKWSLGLSILAGILKDVFGANMFGINILLFSLWNFIIKKLSKNITLDNDLVRILLVFVIAIFNNIIIRVIFLFLGRSISWGMTLRIISLEPIYTALVAPLVFKVTKLNTYL